MPQWQHYRDTCLNLASINTDVVPSSHSIDYIKQQRFSQFYRTSAHFIEQIQFARRVYSRCKCICRQPTCVYQISDKYFIRSNHAEIMPRRHVGEVIVLMRTQWFLNARDNGERGVEWRDPISCKHALLAKCLTLHNS